MIALPNIIAPPNIVHTEAQHYACIHLQVPRAEIHAMLVPALNEVHVALEARNLPIRPWFAHRLTLSDGDFDFEVCLPVDHQFPATGRVQPGLWPAGNVARTFYHGDYPGLPAAWGQFSQWLRANNHPYATHIYERYVVNQSTTKNPAEFRTELSWPLTEIAPTIINFGSTRKNAD